MAIRKLSSVFSLAGGGVKHTGADKPVRPRDLRGLGRAKIDCLKRVVF